MRVLEVLLTGYKPCKGLSPNPGWQAIKELDGVILEVDEELRLRVHAVELENAYTRLLETIPTFYGLPPQWPPQDGPDDSDEIARRLSEQHFTVILHVGGDDTRQIVSLEHDTPRWGYPESNDYPVDGDDSKEATAGAPKDANGRRGVVGAAWDHLGNGKDELLDTRIDADKVVAGVRERGFEHVQVGYDNAGAPCPFTHWVGQASARRVQKALGKFATLTGFVHVPLVDKPYSISELRQIITRIVELTAQQIDGTIASPARGA